MEPISSKPMGMKWFSFFYTARIFLSVLTVLSTVALSYSLWQENEGLASTFWLSVISAIPVFFVYPYVFYLYRTIWKENRFLEFSKLRNWTYAELGIEFAGSIFSLNPALILGSGIACFLQYRYFSKRFSAYISS